MRRPVGISIHALREEGDFGHCRQRAGRDRISIHALREEGDPLPPLAKTAPRRFLSTPSARRATGYHLDVAVDTHISIHALREEGNDDCGGDPFTVCDFYPRPPRGGRHKNADPRHPLYDFYPRPPRGGRPVTDQVSHGGRIFLSTPSARRATINIPAGSYAAGISIHALREEGDDVPEPLPLQSPISIHALREEGDSTLTRMRRTKPYFYPRPPRGGRRGVRRRKLHGLQISIHALREEGDFVAAMKLCEEVKFLSTSSARRATVSVVSSISAGTISIHALREEGDPAGWWSRPESSPISIHALREEGDTQTPARRDIAGRFLSTPSARRATGRLASG